MKWIRKPVNPTPKFDPVKQKDTYTDGRKHFIIGEDIKNVPTWPEEPMPLKDPPKGTTIGEDESLIYSLMKSFLKMMQDDKAMHKLHCVLDRCTQEQTPGCAEKQNPPCTQEDIL